MATQERSLASERVHLGAGVFGQVACSALVLPREHRDSLGPIEVEIMPAGKPARLTTAWTMLAIGALAMVFALLLLARKAETAAQGPQAASPGAPLAAPESMSRASTPL